MDGRSIPTPRLVVLPGAGHECYLEFPERFNAEVRGSLRALA
jgi:pimeloyl-ACP methyl ester carboxylesterase